jgi:hypothetical protein
VRSATRVVENPNIGDEVAGTRWRILGPGATRIELDRPAPQTAFRFAHETHLAPFRNLWRTIGAWLGGALDELARRWGRNSSVRRA